MLVVSVLLSLDVLRLVFVVLLWCSFFFFFFFKQKTAYEIVSRDWSSDVCSSDLPLLKSLTLDTKELLSHKLSDKSLTYLMCPK